MIAFSRDSRDPPCHPAMTAHQAALAGTATLQRAPRPVPTAYVTSATPDLHDSETSYAISHADVKLDLDIHMIPIPSMWPTLSPSAHPLARKGGR